MKYLGALLIASTLIASCNSGSNSKPADTTETIFSYSDATPTTAEDFQQRFVLYLRKGLLTEEHLTVLLESQPKQELLHTIVYLKYASDSVYSLHVYVNLITGERSTDVTKEYYSISGSKSEDYKYYRKNNNIYHLVHTPAKDSLNDFVTSHLVFTFIDVNHFTVKFRASATSSDGKFIGTETSEMNASYITDLTKYESELKNIQFCEITSANGSRLCKENQDMTWLLN